MDALTQEQLANLRKAAQLGTGLTLADVQKAPAEQVLGLYLMMSKAALTLVDEVERQNRRLEAVCDVVSNAVAWGEHPEPGVIMEAVRGQ